MEPSRRWVSAHAQINNKPFRLWAKGNCVRRFTRNFSTGFVGNNYQTEDHRVLEVGPLLFEFLVCACWVGYP